MYAGLPFPELHPAIFVIPSIDLGGNTFGPFPLRWYALAYIVGLILAWRYAVALVRRPALFGGTSPASSEIIDDFLFWATLGVILGGRIGYVLFYQLPFEGDRIASDPMMILRVWQGGMSFHGGLSGVAAAMIYVARSSGVPLLRLADIAAAATPIGLLLGRIANFINAELYGRETTWSLGVVFPEGRGSGGTPPSFNWNTGEWVYSGFEKARHASQLYEASLEGALLFVVLAFAIFRLGILKRPGLATGIFLIGYGIGRTVAENFREPDAHIEFIAGQWLTMGMLLSVPMWLGGAYLIWKGVKSSQTAAS